AAVRDCGLPDTLVHGDLHPGNVRARPPAAGRPAGRVLLDWGDSCIGHPAFDVLRLTEGLAPADAHEVIAAWAHRWAADLPGSDPVRAVALLRPVAALRAAAVYADFVANIEPTERPYHASDVPACLRRAVQEAAAS
ncbi:MAG TPA: phosphotransferase, partial [Pilimelia sp.]|nr:phosphotransferase [Pilimelia sp.]